MPRKGKNFELAYKWLYELDKDKYKVTSPAYIFDKSENRKREVDILIEFTDNQGKLRKIGIECRDRKKKEDSMWLEQLITKREDLELDYIIATTTNKFTTGAIRKARYHGLIIEEAEYFDKSLIDNLSKEFFVDLLFMKYEVVELKFIINNEVMTFKEVLSSINVIKQQELLKYLNRDFYFSINPHEIIDKHNIDEDVFFKKINDNSIIIKKDICFNNERPKILKDLEIKAMYINVKMVPFKSSLPLNKSLSIFDVDPKQNKKYSAFFGTEEEYLKIGYLYNEPFFFIKLKNRKYYRHICSNICLNTIFPKVLDESKAKLDKLIETFVQDGLGEFDFTKVY